MNLGLTWEHLDALSRVPVSLARGGANGGTAGFCPYKLLRGELEPSMAEMFRLLATASGLRTADIVEARAGYPAMRDALLSYAVAMAVEFNPPKEGGTSPKEERG